MANLFEVRDLVTAPVIDSDGRLLGRITIDDVVDVIREEAEHSILSMAGLAEDEDMFAPVVGGEQRPVCGCDVEPGSVPNNVYGWGQVDIWEAVRLVLGR